MNLRTRTRLHRQVSWTAIVFALALAAPAAAPAHDGQDHAEQDSVVLKDAATERRLADATVARSAADSQAAAAAVVGNEGDVGQWGPVADWPVVGIHGGSSDDHPPRVAR